MLTVLKHSWRSYLVTSLVILAVLIGTLLVPMTPQTLAAPTAQEGLIGQDDVYTALYERVSPSVVSISVIRGAQDNPLGQNAPLQSGGSGFVYDTEGHIITNNHVVEGAARIEVAFLDGTLSRATIVGLDPDSDLAVIRAETTPANLVPVEFADSEQLVVGQPTLAIGSPFGQRWTLTTGIISALDRTIQGLTDFSIGGVIQTDAAINPGNSGGPLLDLEGRVIGVNSQIISETRQNSGIGFAIPSNLTQRVAQQLIEEGFVQYSYLGIGGGDVTLAIIEALELPSNFQGVAVSEVVSGGPAARAGLQGFGGDVLEIDGVEIPTELDIITAIDGTPLNGIGDLITYLARNTTPGDMVVLNVLRNGEETLDIEVRLTPRP